MTKKDWNIDLKKLTTTKGVDRFRMEITPFRDWMIVVIVLFISLIASIGFNIFLTSEANRDALFSATPKAAGVLKFNEEGLVKIIKEIDDRAERFEKAKTQKIELVDPAR